MTWAARIRAPFIVLALFTVLAGDVWRYTLGYIGWGVFIGVLGVVAVTVAIGLRVELRRIPLPLLVYLAIAAASVIWSQYPGATALGVALLAIATFGGVLIARITDRNEFVTLLGTTLKLILAASLLFELVVATIVRERVYPIWTDYDGDVPAAFAWSRNLLFEGGRIQGVVGNSNLLGMLALLALIVFGLQLADARSGGRDSSRHETVEPRAAAPLVGWVLIAAGTFLLTRSSTVIVASVVVAIALVLLLVARRLTSRARLVLAAATAVATAVGVALVIALRGPLLALLGRSEDLTGRFDIWAAVTEKAVEHPVLGWGWVGYWVPWVAPFDGLAEQDGVQYLQAHNAWLDVWFQIGIVGLVAFAALIVVVSVRAVRDAVDGRHAAALFPALTMTALLVQSLAESRILIEGGWLLVVVIAVQSMPRRAADRALPTAAPGVRR